MKLNKRRKLESLSLHVVTFKLLFSTSRDVSRFLFRNKISILIHASVECWARLDANNDTTDNVIHINYRLFMISAQLMIFSICDYLLASCRFTISLLFFLFRFGNFIHDFHVVGKIHRAERVKGGDSSTRIWINFQFPERLDAGESFHAWKLDSMYWLTKFSRDFADEISVKLPRRSWHATRWNFCVRKQNLLGMIFTFLVPFRRSKMVESAPRDEYQLNRMSREPWRLVRGLEPFWRSLTMRLERH